METLAPSLDQLDNLPDNRSKLTTLFLSCCDQSFTTPVMMAMFVEFWRLALNEKHPIANELMHKMYNDFAQLTQSILKKGVSSGEFISCDIEKTASAMLAGVCPG